MGRPSNAYLVLGVTISASRDEIRQAYLTRAALAHPDAGGSEAEFQTIRDAYDTLSVLTAKKAHDSALALFYRACPTCHTIGMQTKLDAKFRATSIVCPTCNGGGYV